MELPAVNTSMIKVPFIRRFVNERISIKAATSRDQFVQPFKVDALVMLSDPYALGDGTGPDSSKPKWSVMVNANDIKGREIIPGASILPNGTRPRLMVDSVHLNGDSFWMDCTAVKGAV